MLALLDCVFLCYKTLAMKNVFSASKNNSLKIRLLNSFWLMSSQGLQPSGFDKENVPD
jgi:hypothetical protein